MEFIERYGVSGKFADLMKPRVETPERDYSEVEKRVLAEYAKTKNDDFYRTMMGDFVDAATNTVDDGPKTFGPDKIREMMAAVKTAVNASPPLGDIRGSDHLIDAISRASEPRPVLKQGDAVFGGISIHASTAFPYTLDCHTCGGTGEGIDSSICERCHGAGAIRVEGMMRQGRSIVLLTSPLPSKFSPRFPTGLVDPPMLCRGLV